MLMARWIGMAMTLTLPAEALAGVVINEIFYNAPEDRDQLQWIELFNSGDEPVDLSDWSLDGGKVYTFPKGTAIPPIGYLVVALDPVEFSRFYRTEAIGPLKRPLKRGSERLELTTSAGQRADVARYKDREPWPVSADAYSASLERICASEPGDLAENWAASPLPEQAPKPAGTPAAANTCRSAVLPPIIAPVGQAPDAIAPDKPLRVEAEVKHRGQPCEVTLLYRLVIDGVEGPETPIAMPRDPAGVRHQAQIPGQKAHTLIRYRIRARTERGATRHCPAEHDLRPSFSTYVLPAEEPGRIAAGRILHVRRGAASRPGAAPQRRGGGPRFWFPGLGGQERPRPPRGSEAFVYFDPASGKTRLFDYIHVVERGGHRGYKVFFHKDRLFKDMSSVSLVYEGSERFLLAEALAYDVYRRAGNPASLTEFVRVWVDGELIGYQLLIERPNRSFLRRHKIDDNGHLYKLVWYGQGITGQHEKKTHARTGHADLLDIIQKLAESRDDAQWRLIQDHFNVEQVATYFAVNMVLSHWDGFFNNHFVYHDTQGTGKWEIYPWDQDKTWGYHDGLPESRVFFDMPLSFGMEGDLPPGRRNREGSPPPGGGGPFAGAIWWRPGGYFSRPLLANPRFRKIFLNRVREILETVYTEENYFPLIDDWAGRLSEDVRIRARCEGREPDAGTRQLEHNVRSLRTHLQKRRAFLLEQAELRPPDTRPAGTP